MYTEAENHRLQAMTGNGLTKLLLSARTVAAAAVVLSFVTVTLDPWAWSLGVGTGARVLVGAPSGGPAVGGESRRVGFPVLLPAPRFRSASFSAGVPSSLFPPFSAVSSARLGSLADLCVLGGKEERT